MHNLEVILARSPYIRNITNITYENRNMVWRNEFTWRTTYNYKDNDEWNAKNQELKEIEKKLKIATDLMMKWDTYVDSDWVIIEPVTTTNTEVLTYKKIKW